MGRRIFFIILYIVVLGHESTLHAQPRLTFNNRSELQIEVRQGDVASVTTYASPFVSYALLGAHSRELTQTPFGTLEIDLDDPGFTIAVDGFDPSHPYFSLGSTDSVGKSRLTFRPYPATSSEGDTIYVQALVQDPLAAPFNLLLTNAVGAVAVPQPPRVDSVHPRTSLLDELITIEGEYFTGRATSTAPPIVTMGGKPVTVASYNDQCIQILAPGHVRSGGIRVTTDVGPSPDLSQDPEFYVVILGNFALESVTGFGPYDGDYSIFGELVHNTEVDTYLVSLLAGEELFIEAFNSDSANFVADPFDPSSVGPTDVNAQIELHIPNVPITPILKDNDRGPGYAAAIGVADGQRFVAPFTGDFEIKVRSFLGQSHGDYLLNVWTMPDDLTRPPTILGIHPNYAAPGEEISIFSTGLNYVQCASNLIEFKGPGQSRISTPLTLLANGQYGVQVPVNAVTGHMRVISASGLGSTQQIDHPPSFLMVKTTPQNEAIVTLISESKQVFGSLNSNFDLDHFDLALNLGDVVSVRVHSFDIQNSRLLDEPPFDFNILDAEIQIRRTLWGITEITDVHSGPGIAAHISSAAWNAPMTSTYSLCVHPWLFLSHGDYLLDIIVN